MRSALLITLFFLGIFSCNEVDLSGEPVLSEDFIGSFKAIPDLSKMEADLKKANLPIDDIESLYPAMNYTFSANGNYTLKRSGLNMDTEEKGRWLVKEGKISLTNNKGSYAYNLGRNKEGEILFMDDILNESMNFVLHKAAQIE